MRLRLVTPPAVEPVATADLMAFARFDADPGDGVLQRLLIAARQRVERDTGLALISQTWVASLDAWPALPAALEPRHDGAPIVSGLIGTPARVIEVARRPFQSLVSFQVRDLTTAWQSVDASSYFVEIGNDTGRIVRRPGAVWPLLVAGMADAIELMVVLGFGATPASVPSDLQTAILMLAAHWHETREPAMDGRVAAVPEHVRAILSSWQGRRLR